MPWAARVQVAEPYTRESQYWLPTLRYRDDAAHHDLQQWFALSDPAIEDALPGRGTSAPRAGRAFFVINAETGVPVGNASGSSCSGTGCYDTGDISNSRKNAVQADVTAARAALGFEAKTSLEEGLRRCLEFYRTGT